VTTSLRVVLCSVPSEEVGVQIAQTLLAERLVACVNILPGVRSLYRYKGKLEDDRELLLVMKSTEDRIEALTRRVPQLHPYEVCEVIALEVDSGHQPYLDWVISETR
jgi:periplasmic divalent cation tolerance protein